MTTRVPTTATYRIYMNNMSNQKSSINRLSYQATTGNKYDSYDQYGLSSYRILSLQNEQSVVEKYLETNSISQVVLESQQKAVDDIRSAVISFRDQLREFFANDLTKMSKDPSEEELIALQNTQEAAFEAMSLMAYYLNSQVDGNYIFGGGKDGQKPVDFPYTTLEDFQAAYDGKILTYPTSYSASLSEMSSTSELTNGATLKQNFQTLTPKTTVRTGEATNEMRFDSANKTLTANNVDTFKGFSAGDKIGVTGTAGNNKTLTVASVSDDGKTLTFVEDVADETLTNSAGVTLTKGWSFVNTPEDILQNQPETNVLKGATGEFSNLKAGEKMKIEGTGANDGYKTIESISLDGSTVTFKEQVVTEAPVTTAKAHQSLDTGTITAQSNAGTVIQNFTVNKDQLTVAGQTLKALNANTFANVKAGQNITINDKLYYVKDVSDDGKTLTFSGNVPDAADWTGTTVEFATRSDTRGFITDSLKGSALQTGDIGFYAKDNAMKAAVKGAFSSYKTGDTLVVQGADGNDRMYIVKSVSADGRTVSFDDSTPVAEDMNITNGKQITDGKGITIGKSYPVGATVDLGKTSGAYNGKYTVTGVSDDGKTLTVKTKDFPEYGAEETFATADVATYSYYDGGYLKTTYRVSETSAFSNDVTAASSAFEKLFRAMGEIAQGNLLDADNPESAHARVSDALNILDASLNANSKEKNGDITSIQYSVISKLDLVKTTIESQTASKESLTTYINNMTQVDKTEAVTYLLQAKQDLEVSYSVLSAINRLSLLPYL
ncbi:MAG: hypothetical protein KH347_07995 [Acetobacter sp.]|nr:hypothetical protein [Acetobacter sp.]